MGKKSKRTKGDPEQVSEKQIKWGVGCITLLALPFALVGLVAAISVGMILWEWFETKSWVETPAEIIESQLVADADDDGAIFHVTARYAYDYGGQRYESERVTLYEEADNLGSFHHDATKALNTAREQGTPYPCLVNPDDPAEAILFRDLRPGALTFRLLFAVVFGGVGIGMMAAALVGARTEGKRAALERQHPGEPWLWREDWATRRIRSAGSFKAWFVTFFAFVWNMAVWPICYVIWSGQRAANANETWLLGFFPLAGAGIAFWAVVIWWHRLKWGVSELELAALPGVLGGPLAGLVHVPRGFDAQDGYFLRLSCVRSTITRVSGRDVTDDDIVWEHERRVPREAAVSAAGRTVIPVELMIPYDLPSSGDDDIRWQLEARAETSGIDYMAEFEVPVFKTETSSKSVQVDQTPTLSANDESLRFPEVVRRMGGVLERDSLTGRTILFPMARHRGLALYTFAWAVGWTALTAFIFTTTAPTIVRAIFVAIELLVIATVIVNVFCQTRLEFGERSMSREYGVLGIRWRRELLPGEIAAIRVQRSGNRYGNTVFREVVAETQEKKFYTLAGDIPRAPDAERLATEIRAILKSSKSRTAEQPSRMNLETELPEELRGNEM